MDKAFPSYNLVQKIINEKMDYDLLAISNPGSSGSRVYILRNYDTNKLYAVKCSKNPRVNLEEEKKRRDSLVKYYAGHLPEVTLVTREDDVQIMVSECTATDTLFSMINNGSLSHSSLAEIWGSTVKKIEQGWQTSKHEFVLDKSPRNYATRAQRIADGVEHYLNSAGISSSAMNRPLRIDGDEFPPLAVILQTASEYQQPKYGVVCHGDPNPSNIVVDNKKKWHLVDWEWSGSHHDWRGMASHLYGWWLTRHCSALETPSVKFNGKVLNVKTGDVSTPDYIKKYIQPVRDMFLSVCESDLGNSHDVTQTGKFLTLLYLGEVRFAPIWNREPIIPYLFKLAAIEHSNLSAGPFRNVQDRSFAANLTA